MADRKRVAILGGGIAGLSAAYELSETDEYEVTLYTMGWIDVTRPYADGARNVEC